MNGLSILVTSKDSRGLREFLAANLCRLEEVSELVLMVTGGRGQAAIGNQFAARAFGDVVGLVHSDCLFAEGDLELLTQTAREGKVAGLVGARLLEAGEEWPVKFVWGREQKEERQVSTLDGCSIFFRKDIPVSFDPSFTSFHLVVEDFCLSSARIGIPLVVPPVGANHVGQSTTKPEWQREYAVWKQKFVEKWRGFNFETT